MNRFFAPKSNSDNINNDEMLLSAIEINYFQELCSIFPESEPSIIKKMILYYKDWDKIVNALLQPDSPEVQDALSSLSSKSQNANNKDSNNSELKQTNMFDDSPFNINNDELRAYSVDRSRNNAEKIGITITPTKYEPLLNDSNSSQSCKLYLPPSIIDIPLDLDNFGNFNH